MKSDKGNALIVAIIIIGIIAVIVYVLYLITTTYMKTFDILFGNGWWYIAFWILGTILSNINIPVYKLEYKGYQYVRIRDHLFPAHPFRFRQSGYIYINFGGFIMPLILTCYILSKFWTLFNPLMFIVATLIMILICKAFSRYMRGGSVVINMFMIVFISYLLVQLLPNTINPVDSNMIAGKLALGYCIATLGSLIGGDLLNLHNMKHDPYWKGRSSIGGAGTYDGIWCAGLFVMFWIIALNFLFGW